MAAISVIFIVVAGLVTIAALIINAVVKVKLAKYNSIQPTDKTMQEQKAVGAKPPSA